MTSATRMNSPSQDKLTTRLWPNLAIGIVVLLTWVALFYRDILATSDIWLNSDTYAHGLFILPLTVWLYWRERDKFCAIHAKPSYLAAIVTIGLGLGWFVAHVMEINALIHAFTFMLLSSALWLALGDRFANQFKFPLIYLIFCAPFGNGLIPHLQDITAHITVFLLQLSQIPVYFEGLYITIPTGVFEVAVACSGIRYLIACLAIGSIYAHLSYQHWHKKLVFIAFAILFPILANGLRAYLIVIIAHLSDMKYATGADHLVYGWVFFGVIIYLMFAIGNRWADSEATQQSNEVGENKDQFYIRRYLAVASCLVILLSLVIRANSLIELATPSSPQQIPAQQLMRHHPLTHSNWGIKFQHAQGIYMGISYNKVEVLKAKYAHKQSIGKLVTSTNVFYDPELWTLK